jgi:hypothetical protein
VRDRAKCHPEEAIMSDLNLRLSVLPQTLAVCRLENKSPLPEWALRGSKFSSITASSEEISIVCDESVVPADVKAVKDWRAFKVEGPLDLSMTGIVASLTAPLADAAISVFTLSTYDTDYLLVKTEKFEDAARILSGFCKVNR